MTSCSAGVRLSRQPPGVADRISLPSPLSAAGTAAVVVLGGDGGQPAGAGVEGEPRRRCGSARWPGRRPGPRSGPAPGGRAGGPRRRPGRPGCGRTTPPTPVDQRQPAGLGDREGALVERPRAVPVGGEPRVDHVAPVAQQEHQPRPREQRHEHVGDVGPGLLDDHAPGVRCGRASPSRLGVEAVGDEAPERRVPGVAVAVAEEVAVLVVLDAGRAWSGRAGARPRPRRARSGATRRGGGRGAGRPTGTTASSDDSIRSSQVLPLATPEDPGQMVLVVMEGRARPRCYPTSPGRRPLSTNRVGDIAPDAIVPPGSPTGSTPLTQRRGTPSGGCTPPVALDHSERAERDPREAQPRGARGQVARGVGRRRAPTASTAPRPGTRSSRSTRRRPPCRARCTRATSSLHPHRHRRPLPADAGPRGLLPDGLGRQRPQRRAPRPAAHRHPLRPVAPLRPRLPPPEKVRSKDKPIPVSRPNFVELCGQVVEQLEQDYFDLWSTIGLSVDWDAHLPDHRAGGHPGQPARAASG